MTVRARPWREPTLWFVLVAAAVHVVRAAPVDVAVFLGAAALIVLDARRPPPDRPGLLRDLPVPVLGGVCLAYVLLVLPMARTGLPMRLAVAAPGVLALVVLLRSGGSLVAAPARRGEAAVGAQARPVRRGWVVWAVLLVLGCLLQVVNFVQQPDPQTDSWAHPTLSSLVDPLLAGHLARALVAGLWLAAGLWLLRLLEGGPTRRSRP